MKYCLTFLAGFICASALFLCVISPREDRAQFDDGFTNGVTHGRVEAVEAILKEFGPCDSQTPSKLLFSVHTSDVISIETNGIKTVRVIP